MKIEGEPSSCGGKNTTLSAEVILTADRTLMSNYHRNEFVGFGATAPSNVVPEWFFQTLFFPPIKTNNGVPVEAPYGLRKIEAQLLMEGFNVLTVDPDHLNRYISDAKVLGVHAMDPFGLGPASTTFARILNTGEPYLAKYFREMLEKPKVQAANKRGLKIIVGGPGAWQFKYRPKFMNTHGIDCVIEGEAEKVVGKLFRMALDGEDLPRFYEVGTKETPNLEEIPEIRKPSINGLVEIGRGCCRGCKFCSVTLRPLRWYPYEKIEKEIEVNANAGMNYTVLHAEDVLLYGSKNVIPNKDKVLRLHELCTRHVGNISWSHVSFATVAADPALFRQVAEIILSQQEWWGTEMGIETGSPNLVKKLMRAKAYPFKPEEWPEVVKKAADLMSENNLIPACTLIVGLPHETDDDILMTIELVEDLKDFKSLIIPLFFIPLGQLSDKDWFGREQMSDLHEELLVRCLNHDMRWVKTLMHSYFRRKTHGWLLSFLYRFFIWLIERKAKTIRGLRSAPVT
ncbi:MAG: B12-binding domain-containing radical SAM protein [Candidatus Bathyarchaeia archaeon]